MSALEDDAFGFTAYDDDFDFDDDDGDDGGVDVDVDVGVDDMGRLFFLFIAKSISKIKICCIIFC